jgi:hypothetical protein
LSASELKTLLDQVADTREFVLRRADLHGAAWNALFDAWNEANEEAAEAYREWRTHSDRASYAAYRAAADREDAAQDAVAAGR